jgi:ABC-type lipoprotein export system ATPase subunit
MDKCVIVVSHNENILKYADKVLYMKNGKLGVYIEE